MQAPNFERYRCTPAPIRDVGIQIKLVNSTLYWNILKGKERYLGTPLVQLPTHSPAEVCVKCRLSELSSHRLIHSGEGIPQLAIYWTIVKSGTVANLV